MYYKSKTNHDFTMKLVLKQILLLPILVLIIGTTGCGVKSSYYQKNVGIPGAAWSAKFMPAFKLDISDTSKAYFSYLLIRHDEAYPNSNLWFRLKVKAPGEKVWKDGPRMEIQLADDRGNWFGRSMGGIWEQKLPFNANPIVKFDKVGTYEIKIENLMRQEPLPSVLNIGLILEAVTK